MNFLDLSNLDKLLSNITKDNVNKHLIIITTGLAANIYISETDSPNIFYFIWEKNILPNILSRINNKYRYLYILHFDIWKDIPAKKIYLYQNYNIHEIFINKLLDENIIINIRTKILSYKNTKLLLFDFAHEYMHSIKEIPDLQYIFIGVLFIMYNNTYPRQVDSDIKEWYSYDIINRPFFIIKDDGTIITYTERLKILDKSFDKTNSKYYYKLWDPSVYIEQPDPETSTEEQTNYWYYCKKSRTYYPYVKECPGGWQRVTPQPPPPQ